MFYWAILVLMLGMVSDSKSSLPDCNASGGLKYLQGDALTGNLNCLGPEKAPYPRDAIEQVFPSNKRKGRASNLVDPLITQRKLLQHFEAANYGKVSVSDGYSLREERSLLTDNPVYMADETNSRRRPSTGNSETRQACAGPGGRLCKTRYNTTAPLYGVSLTSGQPVTIVQKFPDLLQQVIFEVCDSKECDVVHGECVQTYVPYLFLVIPLGPVTLTGQDYVLVENGCVCRPKYSKTGPESSLSEALPGFIGN